MSRYFSSQHKPKLSVHEKFHRDFPYLLQLMPSREFLLLNRDYKPLGLRGISPHVNYYDFATASLNLKTVKRVAINNHADIDSNAGQHSYWLYDDGSCPGLSAGNMRVYLETLTALGLTKTQCKAIADAHRATASDREDR